MYNILFLTHTANFQVNDQYLTNKIKISLKKYFNISSIEYFFKNTMPEQADHSNFELKWENTSRLKKILNMLFIYNNNLKLVKKGNYDLIWIGATSSIVHFFIFIYPLFARKKSYFVQTFTPSVKPSKIGRILSDLLLGINLKIFNYVGVNSERNIKSYGLTKNQSIMVQVGVHDYGFYERNFNHIKLLYIGTLNSREVWKSIEGLGIFLKRFPNILIEYNIIGGGHKHEADKIMETIQQYGLEDRVKYYGYLPFEKVKEFFKICNVGIAYVPINNYFQNSSTKTLEYLVAGMPVIATNNSFRGKIVTNESGVLIEDTAESFSKGLEKLIFNIKSFDQKKIRSYYSKYSMDYSISNEYVPQLIKIITESKEYGKKS